MPADKAAVGAMATDGIRKERKGWLVLEGTVGSNGKPVASVGDHQLKVLRAAREEVRATEGGTPARKHASKGMIIRPIWRM